MLNIDQFELLNNAHGLTEEQAEQLIDGYRTLQKQNKKLAHVLDNLLKHSDAATSFIVKSAPYFDAKIVLNNLRGGTDNA